MLLIDTTRSSFSWANARACLERSELAYSKSGQALPSCAHLITNEATEAQAIVFDERNCISVAFRGSQSPEDFIHDAECWMDRLAPGRSTGKRGHALVDVNPVQWLPIRRRLGFPSARVHHGFLFDWDSISTDVLASVARLLLPFTRKKIFVEGHSLGGALAVLGANEFCRQGWNVGGVYTFGQPRVGDAAFVSDYESAMAGFPHQLGDLTYRVVNENDIVPRVPLPLAGYRHGGQLIFLCAPGSFRGRHGVLTNPHWWQTADSDFVGFVHAVARNTDVLVGDHYLKSYQERIKTL
ncbi:MAG TPA: lipase family protein [Verrucomicrobiae bacterium]|nr:lipase family protein [Verrucomicrobiae bacterium]